MTPAPSAPLTPLTPLAPSSGVGLVPEALACNITIISETLRDVSGCYAGRASSTSKGTWVQLDESSRIEWKVRNCDKLNITRYLANLSGTIWGRWRMNPTGVTSAGTCMGAGVFYVGVWWII